MLSYLPSPKVVDRVGIIPAIVTLGVYLRQGDYFWNVQWETAHKTSAWYGSAYGAGSAYIWAASGDGIYFASGSLTMG